MPTQCGLIERCNVGEWAERGRQNASDGVSRQESYHYARRIAHGWRSCPQESSRWPRPAAPPHPSRTPLAGLGRRLRARLDAVIRGGVGDERGPQGVGVAPRQEDVNERASTPAAWAPSRTTRSCVRAYRLRAPAATRPAAHGSALAARRRPRLLCGSLINYPDCNPERVCLASTNSRLRAEAN